MLLLQEQEKQAGSEGEKKAVVKEAALRASCLES